MITPQLLEILCCPETHLGLRAAEPKLLDALNRQIVTGHLRNRGGQLVRERLEAGLVRMDNQCLYPVRQEIPVLLIQEAIALEDSAGVPGQC